MSSFWNKLKNFSGLVRLSHTIFALPFALGAMLLAVRERNLEKEFHEGFHLPEPSEFVFILFCMVTARNVAMAFNRLVDAEIDEGNPRTASRHIPAGLLSKKSVLVFIVVNAAAFCGFAFALNKLAFYLSIPTLVVLCSYSLFKRFSWAAHLFLGIAIGLSPLGAWVAIKGELALIPAVLGLLLASWIAGFDIIYATADREFDEKSGLHSIPVRFGERGALVFAGILHAVTFFLTVFFGYYAELGVYWWLTCLLIGCLLLYLHFLRRGESLDSLNADFFVANSILSVLVLIALLLETQL